VLGGERSNGGELVVTETILFGRKKLVVFHNTRREALR
jgi:hypothetical protein